ncbi:unnamed protein product [Anisakis simplex]|uniref:Chitin-binding type-2 domain-containing protein n=1 Tax=Anisakis simplex TaxID=6269 RepID=A0A0M3KD69_ANISI|nr:unnamed protein product [Anisakis simplex]
MKLITLIFLHIVYVLAQNDECVTVVDRYANCEGYVFVPTRNSDDEYKVCQHDADCEDQREPPAWCRPDKWQNWM